LTRRYEPLAIRQLILNSHYRSPIDFSDAALYAAQSGYDRITETVKAVRKRASAAAEGKPDEKVTKQLEQLKGKFETAMDDDLNTSIALSVIFELVRLANGLLEAEQVAAATLGEVDDMLGRLGGDVLGLVKDEYPQAGGADAELLEKLVNVFIEQRSNARERKDFVAADALRDRLEQVGIVLEDKAGGATTWRRK